eukprot:TRINITY_DN2599_c6_g1_i1.p1 TRINITY_DN2599_c6_g1~~TRINITY_DN2599_c6_g1_i1.p1  ORF type:complete len:118 (+),score=7.10 TRINITY_DN2599_c6_g1_i1:346-699(+)
MFFFFFFFPFHSFFPLLRKTRFTIRGSATASSKKSIFLSSNLCSDGASLDVCYSRFGIRSQSKRRREKKKRELLDFPEDDKRGKGGFRVHEYPNERRKEEGGELVVFLSPIFFGFPI